MRKASFLAILLAALCAVAPAAGAELRVGLAAPLSGAAALLGDQMRIGGEAAVASSEADVSLTVVDTGCSAEGGVEAARRLVDARVGIVAGFLCMEAIEAALPILGEAGIPVVTTGVRVDGLTDRRQREGWQVFRFAPRADAEADAVARILTRLWRDVLFAIVDDGTIYGRDLAEDFRLQAEMAQLRPVFTDTFRPQLDNQIGLAGRLRRAGASHVFVGGDRSDVAILGRDAAALDYELVIAGGEALRAARDEVDLVPGTLMVGLPEWPEVADAETVAALRAAGVEPHGYVLPTYGGMQVAIAALNAAAVSDTPVVEALAVGRFVTVLGEAGFDDKGDWIATPHRLFRYDGAAFRRVD